MIIPTIALLVCSFLSVLPCSSQQIRILVLDAHHGSPVSNECVVLSLGSWLGADVYAPTNKEGVAIVSISEDSVSAEAATSTACGTEPLTKNFPHAKAKESIAVFPWMNVSCQYSKEQTKNPNWLHNPRYQKDWIPSFKLSDLLTQGVVAQNNCSKLKPSPVPGELILITRKVTLWEGMRE